MSGVVSTCSMNNVIEYRLLHTRVVSEDSISAIEKSVGCYIGFFFTHFLCKLIDCDPVERSIMCIE